MSLPTIPPIDEFSSSLDCLGVLDAVNEKTCWHYARYFWTAAAEMEAKGNTVQHAICAVLGFASSLRLNPTSVESPYSSPAGDHQQDSAIFDVLDESHLALLENLVERRVDCELRARIADILWLKKHDYRMAQAAIESYLESASRVEHPKNWVECIDRIARAVTLVQQLGRTAEQVAQVTHHIEIVLEEYQANDPLYLSQRLMELLLKLDQGDSAKYAAMADGAATSAERQHNWERARDYWLLKARWHARAKEEAPRWQCETRAAETYVNSAAERRGGDSATCAIAADELQMAIQALCRVPGTADRRKELHTLMLEYQQKSADAMPSFQVEVDFKDCAREAQEKVKGKSLLDAIFILATMLRSRPVADLRSDVQKSREEYAILYAFQKQLVDSKGRIKAVNRRECDSASSLSDEMLPDMFGEAGRTQEGFAMGVIEPARQQMCVDHNPRVDTFHPIVTDNPFVPPGREYIFALGLHAGLTRNPIAAASILVPQVENSIRDLLEREGVKTSVLRRDGTQADSTLEGLLKEEKLKGILGEDAIFDLRGLLVEEFGTNLRNSVAHGLVSQNGFFSPRVTYFWWLILHLCCVPKARAWFGRAGAGQNSDASRGDQSPPGPAPMS